jgi:hypothetical protein
MIGKRNTWHFKVLDLFYEVVDFAEPVQHRIGAMQVQMSKGFHTKNLLSTKTARVITGLHDY